MKKVLYGEELREKILEAVELLGNTVSTTLGPTGNNVLISNGEAAPFITNDGVTIASSLESDDRELNAILEILKESSLKTNELVGDGTTTTIVLLQSIIEDGMEEIRNGKNPLMLKKELQESLEKILPLLEERKRNLRQSDYLSIASTSANSLEVGKILSKAFSKVHRKASISLEESSLEKTYIGSRRGYSVDINSLSSLYFQKIPDISLKKPYVLILKGCLESLEKVSECINECMRKNESLVIISEEVEEMVERELLSFYLNHGKNIFAVSLAEYASHRDKIELDLAELAQATIKDIDHEKVTYEDLGRVREVSLNKEELVISSARDISKYMTLIEQELEKEQSEYEREFLEKRLSNLEDEKITIFIGTYTKTEMKELKMRYEDALWALEIAKEGVLPGEGISLLEISDSLLEETSSERILKKSLKAPFYKILENMGEDPLKVHNQIKEWHYQKVFHSEKKELENIILTKILDPVKVVMTSLKNAVSIASLLLTITHLVINEEEKTLKEI